MPILSGNKSEKFLRQPLKTRHLTANSSKMKVKPDFQSTFHTGIWLFIKSIRFDWIASKFYTLSSEQKIEILQPFFLHT